MRIRPLNDIVILDMEEDYVMTDNPEVSRIVQEGLVVLPDKNSLKKVAAWGKIVLAGPKCFYPFKKRDRVMIENNLYHASPCWHIEGNKKYRVVREHMLALIEVPDDD